MAQAFRPTGERFSILVRSNYMTTSPSPARELEPQDLCPFELRVGMQSPPDIRWFMQWIIAQHLCKDWKSSGCSS